MKVSDMKDWKALKNYQQTIDKQNMPKDNYKYSKAWVDSIKAQLDILQQTCSNMPANERLDVKDLNEILESFNKAKATFLFMCALRI